MDLYISQHAIYMSKLEKALEKGEPFEHKTCNIECVERLHCEFHELASKIDTSNPSKEDLELLKRVKRLSTELFQELLKLKRLILSQGE